MAIDSIPFLIALGIISILVINDQMRKGSINKTHAHYSDTFLTDLTPDRTFKAIMAFATQNKNQIDDFDEQRLIVIINERMTWKSSGSLYLIHVREQAGKAIVEVGIASKLGKVFLFSPLNKRILTLRLERMLNAVKGAVFAYDNK